MMRAIYWMVWLFEIGLDRLYDDYVEFCRQRRLRH